MKPAQKCERHLEVRFSGDPALQQTRHQAKQCMFSSPPSSSPKLVMKVLLSMWVPCAAFEVLVPALAICTVGVRTNLCVPVFVWLCGSLSNSRGAAHEQGGELLRALHQGHETKTPEEKERRRNGGVGVCKSSLIRT